MQAHTAPTANASTRVLAKCGFDFVGEVMDPEDGRVWRWERTRESALMRALGLTRGQLRLMLLTEASLVAALAIVLGTGLGVTFGAVMVHGFVLSAGGQGVLSVPYGSIALYALTGVAAALAAAVLPARRAARTSVVGAMAEA